MSQIYFCYVRDPHCQILDDGLTDDRLCILSSLDFPSLINHGYSIEIIDFFFMTPPDHSLLSRYRRLSLRISQYIITHNKLPNKKRL